MRAVIVTLSGDPDAAEQQLGELSKGIKAVHMGRDLLEKGTLLERVRALRRLCPDLFCIMTESIDWQYGQEPLLLFGALGGARESLVLDSRGRQTRRGRCAALLFSPLAIVRSFGKGRLALSKARNVLTRLETLPIRSAVSAPDRSGDISIAYLRATPAAGTQPGGATSHINGVVKALQELGARIKFISNDDIAGLDTMDLDFKKISPDPDVMPRAAFDLHNGMKFSLGVVRDLTSKPADLIYQRYCRFSWAGVEASRATGVPLFLEYNGSEVWIGRNWDRTEQLDLLERCEKLNLAAATRIFVISEVERQNLLNAGIQDDKIVVNPNGVDVELFRPGIGGDAERDRLGIPSGRTVAGFVGTFGPWHGVLALAEAIVSIPVHTDIHFLLIGDGSLRGQVEEILLSGGALERVTFAGIVPHDRVPSLLDACDILVSPHVPLADGSAFFGSPTKLFEYMAMGKAIVASRLGQIGDVLTDGETALLVEPGDVKELGNAIGRLVNDKDLRSRLGTQARRRAIEDHTWLRNGQRVLEAYRSL